VPNSKNTVCEARGSSRKLMSDTPDRRGHTIRECFALYAAAIATDL
jgi:hypothetical protein